MRTKLQEQLLEVLNLPQGLALFSAPPGAGLRSTMDAVLHACDRFTREFAALEEESNRYQDVENIPITTYNTAGGQTAAEVLPKFFRMEPNVTVIRDLVDGPMVEMLCEQIPDGRLIISTIRAKDCAEALLRVLALGASPSDFSKVDHGGREPAIDPQAVRRLQGGLRAAPTGSSAVGHSGRPCSGVLPPVPAESPGTQGAMPDLRRNRLLRTNGNLRGLGRRRESPQDAGRESEAGRASPGRAKGWHEEHSGRRCLVGSQGPDFPAGVDASIETVSKGSKRYLGPYSAIAITSNTHPRGRGG